MSARYAVYLAPAPETGLWQRASRWLGRDAARDEDTGPPGAPGLDPARIAAITAEPRRYGFHATLKAPFHLAAGATPDDLCKAAEHFAHTRLGLAVRLQLAALESFLALTEVEPNGAIVALHADALAAFEPFRAPLSEADRTRRLAAPLTARQRDHLDAWGYPHVLEDFRLHFTLTGRLTPDERIAVQPALERYFAEDLAHPLPIDAICVFEQPSSAAPFRIRHRAPFATAE